MPTFLIPETKKELLAAAKEIESHSSAEIVIAVRGHSRSYLHIDLGLAMAAAVVTLAVLLFGSWPVQTLFLLLDPLLIGLLVFVASTSLSWPKYHLSRQHSLHHAVKQAAALTFLQRGIHNTRGRTGVLIYISILERWCEVVADSGIALSVPEEEWQDHCTALGNAVATSPAHFIQSLAALGIVLKDHLPIEDDDSNELHDEVLS